MINKLILEQIKGESGSIKLRQDRLCWYRSQEQSPSCEFKLLCSVRVLLHKKNIYSYLWSLISRHCDVEREDLAGHSESGCLYSTVRCPLGCGKQLLWYVVYCLFNYMDGYARGYPVSRSLMFYICYPLQATQATGGKMKRLMFSDWLRYKGEMGLSRALGFPAM